MGKIEIVKQTDHSVVPLGSLFIDTFYHRFLIWELMTLNLFVFLTKLVRTQLQHFCKLIPSVHDVIFSLTISSCKIPLDFSKCYACHRLTPTVS